MPPAFFRQAKPDDGARLTHARMAAMHGTPFYGRPAGCQSRRRVQVWPCLQPRRASQRIEEQRMSGHSARLTMAFSNIGHFFAHFLMLLYPTVVLALDVEFGLSYGALLSLSLAGFILFGAGALPAGWLGDRWST